MKSTASLFPELVNASEEKSMSVEKIAQTDCRDHRWIDPEEGSSPEVVAECSKCGLLMVRARGCPQSTEDAQTDH